MTNTNDIKSLDIGSKVEVDGFGRCTVKKLLHDSPFTKHYQATTNFGDAIRICWNGLLGCWIQYSRN